MKVACPSRDGQEPHEWGYTYTNIGGPRYTKNCVHCDVEGELEPFGGCLACGHYLPLVIWSGEVRPPDGKTLNPTVDHGICDACRALAEPNRGPCSWERGCACAKVGRTL